MSMLSAAPQKIRETNPHLGHIDDVIPNHLRLVHMVIRKYTKVAQSQGISYEDLYGEGCVGLLKAFDKFDPTKFDGKVTKFSTYAVPMILGEIQRFLRDKGQLIRTPRSIAVILPKVLKLINEGVAVEDIAKDLQCSPNDVRAALEYQRQSNLIALEQPIDSSDNESLTVSEKVGMVEDFSVIHINELMDNLSERDQAILKMRIKGYEQKEIGKRIGISQVQVSRSLAKIKEQIKAFFNQDREGGTAIGRSAEVDKSLITKEKYLALSTELPDYKIANQFNISSQSLKRLKDEWELPDRRLNPAKPVKADSEKTSGKQGRPKSAPNTESVKKETITDKAVQQPRTTPSADATKLVELQDMLRSKQEEVLLLKAENERLKSMYEKQIKEIQEVSSHSFHMLLHDFLGFTLTTRNEGAADIARRALQQIGVDLDYRVRNGVIEVTTEVCTAPTYARQKGVDSHEDTVA